MPQIRNLQSSDIESAIALQQTVYQDLVPLRREQFAELLKQFPRGQFVAELNGSIVGMALSLVILWEEYSLHHTWASITNHGNFDTHNIEHGKTLYGVEVCVNPAAQGAGVGKVLYEARRNLCRAMNLKRIIAGGRLPGYKEYAHTMTPQEYANRVIWGDIFDPVLRFQLNQGFDYCGILNGYIPTDHDSSGNASLIVWLNHDFDASQPTKLP